MMGAAMAEPEVYRKVRFGKPRTVTVPKGFADEQDFLRDMRENFDLDLGADRLNRQAAIEDLKFLTGDQWDDGARAVREDAKRPVLTINRAPAFVAQIVGNRRLNQIQVKIVPDNGGTREVATLREDLLRSIQKNSNAETAYDNAFQNVAACGIGNFQIRLDYADGDVFEQDISIEPIPNALAVVWDRASVIPSGKDAAHCFVVESMDSKAFKRLYPDVVPSDVTTDTAYIGDGVGAGWYTQDTVRIVNYWRMCKKPRTLALMKNGTVLDITGMEDTPELLAGIATDDQGLPVLRESDVPYAEMWACTGSSILEGPYTLEIDRVPVFRVQGWEVNVGEERRRWGIMRFLKDPMRFHNYWRSVIAERLLMAPKARWVAAAQSIEGRENEWRNAHLSTDSVLIYDAENGPPPTFTPPVIIEPGLVQFAEMAVQDIRDVSNIHEASLGQQSNEVSGKAIIARQRVGELGSVGYNDNADDAIRECGRVCDQLIPKVYSGPRTVLVVGEDGHDRLVPLNQEGGIDISVGKYKVSTTTGPSYVTKRVEAAEAMLNMVNAMPQTMAVAADKIVESQDWPGAQEIARRLRMTLPPGMVEERDMTPEMRQQQQEVGQAQAQQAQITQQMAMLELQKKQAEVAEMMAKAELAKAQADKARSEVGVQAAKVAADAHADEAAARNAQAANRLKAVEIAHPEPREPNREPSRASAKS